MIIQANRQQTNGNPKWQTRISGILKGIDVFFPTANGSNIMVEVACEPQGICDVDQPSFKAFLSRWMAATTQMAPYTFETIMPKLQASAKGAASQCSGGDGTVCGRRWTQSTWDGKTGVGEQMSALSVIQANLIMNVEPPVTNSTGGTSKGNSAAGSGAIADNSDALPAVTSADRVGAGITTSMIVLCCIGAGWWMVTD